MTHEIKLVLKDEELLATIANLQVGKVASAMKITFNMSS